MPVFRPRCGLYGEPDGRGAAGPERTVVTMSARVKVYTRCSTRRGQIRRWWNYRVRHYPYETCDRCGRGYPESWWCASDSLFHATHETATGGMLGGLLCPICFTRFAFPAISWLAIPTADLGQYVEPVAAAPSTGSPT